MQVSVLFVCMGNICRSPLAEGVFRQMLETEGLAARVRVDSAGTHGFHVGDPPDPRAIRAAARRGIDLRARRVRQAHAGDFHDFDYLLVMDQRNREDLLAVAPSGLAMKVRLLMEFADPRFGPEVPDPYYGGLSGFERTIDLVEEAARGLLAEIRRRV